MRAISRNFVEHGADLLDYASIDFVLRIEREYFLARNIDDHFAKGNPAQLPIFVQQPRNELIDWRFRRWYAFLRESFCDRQSCGGKN